MSALMGVSIALSGVAVFAVWFAALETRRSNRLEAENVKLRVKNMELEQERDRLSATQGLFAGSPLAVVADEDGDFYSWNDIENRWDPVFYSAGGQMMSMGIGDLTIPFRFPLDQEKERDAWKNRLPRDAYSSRTNRDAQSRSSKMRWYPSLAGEEGWG